MNNQEHYAVLMIFSLAVFILDVTILIISSQSKNKESNISFK
jgi:hypothetical protein